MSSNVQNILIIVGIILIGGLGYYMYTQNSSINLNNSVVTSQASMESSRFLHQLQQLQTVKLDGQIFSDPRFKVLTNLSVPVTPSYVGNSNPFGIGN